MMAKSVVKVPTFNRVLVKPLASSVSSTLYVEDRSAYVRGEIVAAGPMAGQRDKVQHHVFVEGQIATYDRMKAVEVDNGDPSNKFYLVNDDAILLLE
jgi:hypothetical protein